MNSLIADIKNEIMEQFAEWEGDDIDEFKYYYGNDANSIYYYDFKIEYNMVLPCIDYIVKSIENSGLEADHSVMKKISSYEGLKRMVLYWVMEHIDFEDLNKKVCEGCGDSLDICESSSHPCYKCDGGCGKVMGSNDNCIRICEDCKKN